ncbi:hypothetical protein NDU88_004158 [Pleurodeles waltl]|uniref:Uncharacterized protein n=1 Tax=Pleurodeles waltl TaxID=8319 RepID=A0AAV7MXP9_PLEWA|nr:hypothetical protein NDU88_004158 [Pleurodeles waltl]
MADIESRLVELERQLASSWSSEVLAEIRREVSLYEEASMRELCFAGKYAQARRYGEETRDERRERSSDARRWCRVARVAVCSPRASGARHTVWGLPLLAAARASRRTAAESRCQQENSRGKPGSRVSCFCELPPVRGARSGAEAAGRGGAASASRRV